MKTIRAKHPIGSLSFILIFLILSCSPSDFEKNELNLSPDSSDNNPGLSLPFDPSNPQFPCEEETEKNYSENIWPILRQNCLTCHQSSNNSPSFILYNDRHQSWNVVLHYINSNNVSLLYEKPAQMNDVSHSGGTVLERHSKSIESLRQFVENHHLCLDRIALENNLPPVIDLQSFSVNPGEALNVQLLATDTHNDSMRFELISESTNATVHLSQQGTLSYTPNNSFVGTDAIFVRVIDSYGASSEAQVVINVVDSYESNIPPHVPITEINSQINEVVNYQIIGLDGDDDDLSFFLDKTTQFGSLTLSSEGLVTYTPDFDFTGLDSFVFQLSDGKQLVPFAVNIHVHNAFIASTTVSRRLNNREIDNTLSDWLYDESRPASTYLSPDERAPFDTLYSSQRSSMVYVTQLELLARDVARRAVSRDQQRERFMPCRPLSSSDSHCFQLSVEALGLKAFRRPLHVDEIEARLPLLDFSAGNPDADFWTSINLLIQSFILDPEFLYRIERNVNEVEPSIYKLSDYEIAARMSYLIWGSIPDNQLLDIASRGGLSNTQTRQAEFERMFLDPKALRQIEHFHAMWLGYSNIMGSMTQLHQEILSETSSLLEKVIFQEASNYLNVFQLNETYLTPYLSEHYGIDSDNQLLPSWFSYSNLRGGGILSHGTFLGAFSKFSDTSPTKRGMLINERLWCGEKLELPVGIDVDTPPEPTSDSHCKIDRYKEHSRSASCAQCHDQVDPIGFGLENFNRYGQFREHDDGHPECIIETGGYIKGVGPFVGPRALAEGLISSQVLERCVVRHYLKFTLGTSKLESNDSILENDAFSHFKNSGFQFHALISSIIAHPSFILKREGSESK